MRTVGVALVLLSLLLLAAIAWAHGGGLDATGGHNDRKSGGYHFHRGPLAGRSFPSKSAAMRALAAANKPADPQPAAGSTEPDPATVIERASSTKKIDALIRLLVKKKLITEAELAEEILRGH